MFSISSGVYSIFSGGGGVSGTLHQIARLVDRITFESWVQYLLKKLSAAALKEIHCLMYTHRPSLYRSYALLTLKPSTKPVTRPIRILALRLVEKMYTGRLAKENNYLPVTVINKLSTARL